MSLLQQLDAVASLAASSKWGRFAHKPWQYLHAIGFRNIAYKRHKTKKIVEAKLFFGKKMKIALPASTDIYLTGGKTHISEIKLARYLIRHLQAHDTFVDIGAHYGYFSYLAAEITQGQGKVFSFEPSPESFELLAHNHQAYPHWTAYNMAVGSHSGKLTFFQFPNQYSEYNSFVVEQYKHEDWFPHNQPQEIEVPTTTIDSFFNEHSLQSPFIKIDVEGAENTVIEGAQNFLQTQKTILIMEYLSSERNNQNHQIAAQLLKNWGYQCFAINKDGLLVPISDIDEYLYRENLDSDNVVFSK